MLPSFSYTRPETLEEAVKKLSSPGTRVHAGGTDLLGCLRDGTFEASAILSLKAIPRLAGIGEVANNALRIGAMTTVREVAESRVVAERYAALSQAAAVVASPQLRNQGTIGGNICQKPRCWYYRGDFHCLRKGGNECFAVKGENRYHCIFGGELCYIVHPSDTAPALAALQTQVRVTGERGTRLVPMEQFHVPPGTDPQRETVLEPGEIVTEILLPPAAPGLRSSYRKVRARASWDFALAGIALALQFKGDVVEEARVFLSGVAPVPWRSRGVEDAVRGRRLDAATMAKASEAAVAGAQPLEQNGYKVPMLRGLVLEQLEAMARR